MDESSKRDWNYHFTLTFLSAGCGSSGGGDDGGGSDSSDSTAEIILSATPENISTGGTSTISARVTDASGNPVVSEYVAFNADNPHLKSYSMLKILREIP